MIQTVTGTVAVQELGYCQIHEHIFVRHTPMADKNPVLQIDDEEKSLKELQKYRNAGGKAIVDAQPVGAGRDAEVLERLSRQSGVAIIACTGYHLLDFYWEDHWIHTLGLQELEEVFVRELTEGMLPFGAAPKTKERSGSLAGAVKAAIPASGVTGRYETLLRAAALAAACCGAALMLHTESGAGAVEAVELCRNAGVPVQKIIVCHADRQADSYDIHEAIGKTGVYFDYDTIGRYKYHSDESELRLIRHMIKQGMGGQIRLALDTTRARLSAYGGDISLCYLLQKFIPQMKDAGIPGELIDTMTDCGSILSMEHRHCLGDDRSIV